MPARTVNEESRRSDAKVAYVFTLIAHGLESAEQVDGEAVYKTCRDCAFGSRDGRVDFIFHREAASLNEAIGSAIVDLKNCGVAAWLESVESPEEVADVA
jgi:hypothetical protein